MSTMTDNETYNGYANRETWAFNLHWQNDQVLYGSTLEFAQEVFTNGTTGEPLSADAVSDSQLGEAVVSHWRDFIDEWTPSADDHARTQAFTEVLRMFDREVGSWWRIDYREVGEAVRESLDAES